MTRRNRRVVRNARGSVRLYQDGAPIARGYIRGGVVAWVVLYNVVTYFDYFERDR